MKLYRVQIKNPAIKHEFHILSGDMPPPDLKHSELRGFYIDTDLQRLIQESGGQFWFTPSGWKKFGEQAYKTLVSKYPSSLQLLIKDVTKEDLDLAVYKDDYQVVL